MLMVLANKEKQDSPEGGHTPPISVPEHSHDLPVEQLDSLVGSPRRDLLRQAASTTISESPAPDPVRWQNFNQPLPLILKAFDELTSKDETFWQRAAPYFAKRQFVKGQKLYGRGDRPDGFYLLESGMLRCEYDLEQGSYNESIVAGTTCGELPFFSETQRTSSVIAELDCVAWLLTPEKWEELQQQEGDVALQMLKVGMKLCAERMDAITKYVLITAS
jgi:sulfate permease, SulP family